MKKVLFSALFASCFALSLAAAPAVAPKAQEPAVNNESMLRPADEWTFIQVCFLPNVPKSSHNSNVYGVKSGWPITCGIGRIYGLEASWFYSGTAIVTGIQASWCVCDSDYCDGLSASFLTSLARKQMRGVQASSYVQSGDLQGLQAGAVTIAKKMTGFQAGVCAALADEVCGFQTSAVALNKGELSGVQFALYGQTEKSSGVQFGIVNVSKGKGVQFGAFNYMKDALIPFFPIVNFAF